MTGAGLTPAERKTADMAYPHPDYPWYWKDGILTWYDKPLPVHSAGQVDGELRERITSVITDYHIQADLALAGKAPHYPEITKAVKKILSDPEIKKALNERGLLLSMLADKEVAITDLKSLLKIWKDGYEKLKEKK